MLATNLKPASGRNRHTLWKRWSNSARHRELPNFPSLFYRFFQSCLPQLRPPIPISTISTDPKFKKNFPDYTPKGTKKATDLEKDLNFCD